MSGPEILRQSIEVSADTAHDFVINKEKILRVPDQSSGVYQQGAIVTFDLSTISRGTSRINFKKSNLEIPIVMQATLSGDGNFVLNTTTAENAWGMVVKGGNLLQVQSFNLICGQDIVSNTTLNAIPATYEYVMSKGVGETVNYDDVMNFGLDSLESARFSSTIGMNNNTVAEVAFTPGGGYGSKNANQGRIKRGRRTAANSGDAQLSQLTTVANNAITYRGSCISISALQVTWQYLCVIPLACLHDVFAQMPLFRNSNMQLQFMLNSPCSVTVNYGTPANGLAAVSGVSYSIANQGNAIVPFQIAPLAVSSTTLNTGLWISNTTFQATGNSIKFTSSIGKDPSGANGFPTLSVCRLALHMVDLTEACESQYISSGLEKTFTFKNWYAPRIFQNVAAAGGSISDTMVQTNANKLRALVLFPYISASANGSLGLSPFLSPFATEGATCSAGACTSNLNVGLNGVQLIDNANSQWYSYEHFMQNIRPQTLHGGMVLGQTSGVIGISEWEQNYGYVVLDLSEHESGTDTVLKQVSVTFTNQSKFAMDYYAFLCTDIECSINVDLGTMGRAM